jgi:acyl-CoA reductase-like NAD-dependent aldehyde dehydrogenase
VTIGGYQAQDDHGMGRFYEPTVIANVHQGMRLMVNQTFGPIIGI